MSRMIFIPIVLVLTRSPLTAAERHDQIRPVPFTEVKVRGDFWARRIKTNRMVTVRYDFQKCEETGRIANFAVAGGLQRGGFQGIFFNDSDVFKVIEGAAYCLAGQPDTKLDRYLDELISKIAVAQEEDGYLYTARTIGDPDYNYPGREARWSHLASGHELYNVGHLYEAAVAHWQATGKRTLLDVAIKNADLICQTFGHGVGQRIDVPGHQEIEIGLVKLHQATGETKYLDLAKFFIDMRGQTGLRKTYGAYCQDHKPVIEQREAVGHAVRAGYLYAGMADVAAITGDARYMNAIEQIWKNIVSKKMYLTGGVGSSRHGEAFGANYELPNETAYNETCAAIAQALFNHRMFLASGDGKYVDVLERILYNGFLAGVSMSGDRFFYPNPLACNGRNKFNQGELGRSPWFGCSCCPVNVVRFVPSLAGYVYASNQDSVYVNLYIGGSGDVQVGDTKVTLHQETGYPWNGQVQLEVDVPQPTEFTIRLRIPGWARGQPMPSDLYQYASESKQNYSIRLNGNRIKAPHVVKGYVEWKRRWNAGDTISLDLPMPINFVASHENVTANGDRLAVERGPIVYCFEAVDNDGKVSDLVLSSTSAFAADHRSDLLDGVTVITGRAHRAVRTKDDSIALQPAAVTAIPYYAWAHRKMGEMSVWLASNASTAHVPPLPTIASKSHASASHVWPSDSVEAVNDQVVPNASNDHNIPRHTWWDRRGSREWLQYVFTEPKAVRQVAVYWFDDSGQGHCRIPESWRIMYRDGETWKAVKERDTYATERDQFNRVRFTPITTNGLRLEVQLKPNYSAGVLEWQVE